MRIPLLALAAPVLLAVPAIVSGAALLSGSAAAQVTIDLRALDPLPLPGQFPYRAPASPPQPRPPAPPKPRVATQTPPAEAPATPTAATPGAATPTAATPTAATPGAATSGATAPAQPSPTPTKAATAEPQAPLPIVTPPAADLQPVPPPPVASNAPPPPPVSDTATTRAEPMQAGIQVLFDATTTDLSPASLAAIKTFAATVPAAESVSFNVLAYAAGKTDDPSVARRLSLSRALAVRSALVAEGVASTRIYVRALGSQTGGGPPDRVDVSLLGANAAAAR